MGVNLDIREKWGLPNNAKIILYVGNLCRRKKQAQIISAFSFLPKEIAEQTYVLFLGKRLEEDYAIQYISEGNPHVDHFIECGNVDKEYMPLYCKQANAIALLSVSEGFGLSLIEGMHYGLPCISFNDIDAFEDIYDERAMIGVDNHENDSVAKGLETLLTKQWNNEDIIMVSKKFEPQEMAESYSLVFNNIIDI